VWLAGTALASFAEAQAPVMGPEFVIHARTNGQQNDVEVANLGSSGNFLVVWKSYDQFDAANLIGRRFSSAGVPLDQTDFVINSGPSSRKFFPRVASTEAGEFVVTWSEDPPGGDVEWEIRARRFDASGVPLGDDILVNQYTTLHQFGSSVAVDPTGSFFVVWQSGYEFYQPGPDGFGFGVFGRRFDADGQPLGDEFQINQYTFGDQVGARIARKPDGEFIVVWTGWQYNQGIKARRYDAAGVAIDDEFRVNTTGNAAYMDVAVDSAGKAIVVWEDFHYPSIKEGISNVDVRGQRLDAAGNKLGPEFPVATHPTTFELRPQVAVGSDDGFVISWMTDRLAPGTVGAQQFDATGRRRGDILPVNTATLGFAQPAITAQPNGQFVAAWTVNDNAGPQYDVKARLLGFPGVGPIRVDVQNATRPSSPSGASNGNGVLEAGEQVAVEPAFRNSSNGALALSGTASNFQGPAGPVYTLVDATADYGTIDPSDSADCLQATGDCFVVSVTGARPEAHWDATFDETLSYNSFARQATLHVGESFGDVPVDHSFYASVENLFHNGVTGGCAGGGYCPDDSVTRAQMAVFLLKARWGAAFLPLPATGTVFSDVPTANPFAPWIEELYRAGVTGGCGGTSYCPNGAVTRQQMAVFLLKALESSSYDPPDCTGVFEDVPCPSQFADWIEEIADRGITGGCSVTPALYCPTNPNNRGQMAVFLVKTFGLVLYGG